MEAILRIAMRGRVATVMSVLAGTAAKQRRFVLPRPPSVWTAVTVALLAVLPVMVNFGVARAGFVDGHVQAVDFGQEYWPAAARVLHGLNPYALSWQRVSLGVSFPYPALTAVAFVPLALLPHGLADDIWSAATILSLVVALRVVRVADWRIYGLVFLLTPVLVAWHTANLTLLLCLGLALLWRYRDRRLVAAALVAIMISLKPFIWPIGLWFLATRRYRTAIAAAALTLAINLAAFGVIGFGAIRGYLHVSSLVTHTQYRAGYTLLALAVRTGVSSSAANVVALAVPVILALVAVRCGRRGSELGALALTVIVILLATPVLWNHYFTLLLIPLAIYRPRLTPIWLAPLAWWACPVTPPGTAAVVVAWSILAFITAVIVTGSAVEVGEPTSARSRRAFGLRANRLQVVLRHGP